MITQAYPSYRSTALGWVSELPHGWSESRLGRLARIYSGGTPDKTKLHYWENGTVPWVNSGAVNQGIITDISAMITNEAFSSSSARWVRPGALVVALAGQGKTKGMVAQMGIAATCNQSMAAIEPNDELDERYLYWWIDSNYRNIRSMGGGDLRDGLNLVHVRGIPVPLPPLRAQKEIADYLDGQTARIDSLIGKQEQLIETLAERRQAVISHGVTRGFNPNVQIKPSGVEWLGDVPDLWFVSALKRLISQQASGTSVNGINTPAEWNEIGVLKTSSTSTGIFDSSQNKAVVAEDLDRVRCAVRANTIVVNRANSPERVGSAAVVRHSYPNLFLSDKLWQLTLVGVNTMWLYWWLQTATYRDQVRALRVGTSSSMQNLSYEDFREIRIALPGLTEQQTIADRLENETAQMDLLSAKAREMITVLQERRHALISAAVTGKIDVRGLS